MYAQINRIRVPLGKMTEFREHINNDYLDKIRQRAGFLGAVLLEQIDDEEAAELIVLWENHEAVEAFARTGSLVATVNACASYVPGTSVQRNSYVVTARDVMEAFTQLTARPAR